MGPVTRQRIEVATNTWTSPVFRDRFRLLQVHVEYTASATVGDRSLFAELLHEGVGEWDVSSNVNQAATITRHYSYMPGVFRETSFNGNDIQLTFPRDFIILPGDQFRISDSNDRDSADTMVITYRVEEV